MTLAIVTLYDSGAQAYGAFTSEGKQRYASRHGYKFRCFTETLEPNWSIHWSKLKAILQVLEEPGINWVFWSDADAIILDHSVKLESFLDDRYDLLVSNDKNGINTGNFFAKKGPRVKWLFENLPRWADHRDPWAEQSALIRMINGMPHERINGWIKHCGDAFNGYEEQPRGFILHAAGLAPELRLSVLSKANQVDNQ